MFEFHLQSKDEFIPLINGFTVGRVQASLTINDPMVSRRHGVFDVTATKLYYTDETKTNPTLLNGQPLSTGDRTELRMGDILQFGATQVTVKMSQANGHGTAPMRSSAKAAAPATVFRDEVNEEAPAVVKKEKKKVAKPSKSSNPSDSFKLPQLQKEHLPFLLIALAVILLLVAFVI